MKKFYTALFLLMFTNTIAQPGAQDPSFGNNGHSVYPSPFGTSDHKESVIQPDGKIVLAGYYVSANGGDFIVCRYNEDGTLDASFGNGGANIIHLNNVDAFWAVALQSDGKIVAAGLTYDGTSDKIAVGRFNTDGSLDLSFGTNGIAVHDLNGQSDRAWTVAIQNDGKILIAGSTRVGFGIFDQFVARLNSNGTLDTTFNGTGFLTYDIGSDETIQNIAIQSDGKILLAGLFGLNGTFAGTLSRVNANGTPDPTFNGSGTYTYAPVNGDDALFGAVAIRPNGQILVCGILQDGSDDEGLILQLNTNGTLDNSFGANGVQTIGMAGYDDVVASLALQPDGKAVMAGGAFSFTDAEMTVYRVETDGTPDASFGTNGVATIDLSSTDEYLHDVQIDDMGRIVVSGGREVVEYEAVVLRLNGDVVGIEEHNHLLGLSIYPQPFIDSFTITTSETFHGSPVLEVLDATGRRVAFNSYNLAGSYSFRLEMDEDLARGSYTLHITDEGQSTSYLIMKQ